jgi:hypothetical protein
MQKDQCQHQETKDSFSGRKAVPGGALPHGYDKNIDGVKQNRLVDASEMNAAIGESGIITSPCESSPISFSKPGLAKGMTLSRRFLTSFLIDRLRTFPLFVFDAL